MVYTLVNTVSRLVGCTYCLPGTISAVRQLHAVVLGNRVEHSHHRPSHLVRYIPTAAAFGGVAVGALAVSADLLGASPGSGAATVLAATSIFQLYEMVQREGSALTGLPGFEQ